MTYELVRSRENASAEIEIDGDSCVLQWLGRNETSFITTVRSYNGPRESERERDREREREIDRERETKRERERESERETESVRECYSMEHDNSNKV